MRQQRLRDAIDRAYDLHHQADSAISVVASLLVFRDFDYNDVADVAAACTPPIGGTGACTIAKLMKNVVACYKLQYPTKDN